MNDVVTTEKRSLMMAGIKGKNTKPEMLIRKALHARGYRYRLHNGLLPGKPDLAFPKYRAVIFVQGCFWHRHGCHLFKWPRTRPDFWMSKINGNADRDKENIFALEHMGWRVLEIWECSLKGKYRLNFENVVTFTASWLCSETPYGSVAGNDFGGVSIGERFSRTDTP